MTDNPLESIESYSHFVAELLDQPEVEYSTVSAWSESPYTGTAEGDIIFRNGIRLRIREELDFDEAVITAYGYEVYRDTERLYWYDDFPHPNDSNLASTFPHHKHVPPDIKHNRIPAPEMSFARAARGKSAPRSRASHFSPDPGAKSEKYREYFEIW